MGEVMTDYERKMHLETIDLLTGQLNLKHKEADEWREMTARLFRWVEDVDVRDLINRDAARGSHLADDYRDDCERAFQMLKPK